MKRKISVFIFVVFVLLTGILSVLSQSEKSTVMSSTKREVVDAVGRKVMIPRAPKKVVALNAYAAELAVALGCEANIVGMTDGKKFPPILDQKQKVGGFATPSLEKIIDLQPDLVFVYSSSLAKGWFTQLEKAGIPLVLLDCYQLQTFREESLQLGRIFGKEKKAEEYLAFVSGYQDIIQERIAKIPWAKRKRVFVESYAAFSTVGRGGLAEIVEAAGGVSIARNLKMDYAKIHSEWVIEEKPDVIMKALGNSTDYGYRMDDIGLKAQWNKIVTRPGWDQIPAVQSGSVYVMGSDIWLGPQYIVGLAYMAKWFYPELFRDIDPTAIHRELLKKYYHLEWEGTWFYPTEKQYGGKI